jgi:hypothetical protein
MGQASADGSDPAWAVAFVAEVRVSALEQRPAACHNPAAAPREL